jgi:hypothetical protein
MSSRKPAAARGPLGTATNNAFVFKSTRSMQHALPPPGCDASNRERYEALISTQHRVGAFFENVDDLFRAKPNGTGFGRQIFDTWFEGQAEEDVILDDDRWAKYMDSEPRLHDQITIAFRKEADATAAFIEVYEGKYGGLFAIRFHAEVGSAGGGYGSGYQLLHGSNKKAGDFTINGSVSGTRDGDGYLITFDNIEYAFHDIVDPLTSNSLDTELAKVMYNAGMCLNGRAPKEFRVHIKWSSKAPIIMRVPGFTVQIRNCGTGNNEIIHTGRKNAKNR